MQKRQKKAAVFLELAGGRALPGFAWVALLALLALAWLVELVLGLT